MLDINAKATSGGASGHVRVLLPFQDYLTIQAYVGFMNMLAEEIKKGKNVGDLFDPSKVEKKYLPHFSILVVDNECQLRSIGNRNENLSCLLDKKLFHEDAESEAAVRCAKCCGEVETLVKKAKNQYDKALNTSREMSARRKAANKCSERAKSAMESAKCAQKFALSSKQQAHQFMSLGLVDSDAATLGCQVRPYQKAKYDADEAMEHSSSAQKWAAQANAEVWQADLIEKRQKLTSKMDKADSQLTTPKKQLLVIYQRLKEDSAELLNEACSIEKESLELGDRFESLDPAALDEFRKTCILVQNEAKEINVKATAMEEKINTEILEKVSKKRSMDSVDAVSSSKKRLLQQLSEKEGDDTSKQSKACGNCGKLGHNKRTCKVVHPEADEGDSSV